MKGLIVQSPWIDWILDGVKTWEIRGSHTRIRGEIALIKSGTGCIWGTVELVDSIPLTEETFKTFSHLHRIPSDKMKDLSYPTPYAWVLKNPKRFPTPIPYRHPKGAVIWVNLPDMN